MANFSNPVGQSTSLEVYNSTLPHVSMRAHLESISDKVARRALENVKYGSNHFPRSFERINMTLNTSGGSQVDPSIDVEIFSAAPGDCTSPVFIFSHGYGANPAKYRPFLGELASHGYTVLNITHKSCLEEIPGLTPEEETAKMDQLAEVMANNIRYVLNEVRTGTLKNLGCSNKIIIGGHSLGGAASIMVSRSDPAVVGCVDLDGFLKGNARTDGLTQPLLIITGDYQRSICELEQNPAEEARKCAKSMSQSLREYEILVHNSPHSEKIVIPEAAHMDFTDQPFLDYLAGAKNLSAAMRVHRVASGEVLKFLGLCLSVNKTDCSLRRSLL